MRDAIHRYVPAGFFLRFLLDRPRALSIGIMVALFPIGVMALISWLMSTMDGKGPDFNAILAKGTPVNAEVVSTELVTNITVNNRNPVRVVYRYDAGAPPVTDTIQTMAEAAYRLSAGQTVTALVLDGDSILPDFPPVTFPWWAIVIIDGTFFLVGLPFLMFAFHGALTKWQLYRRGRLLSGAVDSLAPAFCVPFTATRMQVAFTCITEEGRAVKGASVVVVDESWKGIVRGSTIGVLMGASPSETCCVVEEGVLAQCPESVR
ncbi:hypothetical protein DSLASN_19240 [Desulfoluna limicola]|uniref:ABC transporter permease n=1 Tax=Desulfoluna limicola TaxID=2810562 RepID=A0ABM7PGV1_9BACT|nr:hypothetical protein [Desulfoluna limicola]BCS96292.1 hypothetical protein DSLASN_19240 [Desulfoluna limicola]